MICFGLMGRRNLLGGKADASNVDAATFALPTGEEEKNARSTRPERQQSTKRERTRTHTHTKRERHAHERAVRGRCSPPPSTQHDQKHTESRSTNLPRQINRVSKEAQFHLGHDDTDLENLMRRLRSNRRPSERHRGAADGGGEEKGLQEHTVERTAESPLGPGSATIFKGLYNADGGGGGGGETVPQDGSYPAAPRYGTDIAGGGGKGAAAGGGWVAPPPPPQRLGKFLRQAGLVMETLCEENLLHASAGAGGRRGVPLGPTTRVGGHGDDSDDRDGRALFSTGPQTAEGWEEVGGWAGGAVGDGGGGGASSSAAAEDVGGLRQEEKQRQLGEDTGSGGGGLGVLLRGSQVVGIGFSKARRSMLVTAHARPVRQRVRGDYGGGGDYGEADDERPWDLEGCGVLCVWNSENVKVRERGKKRPSCSIVPIWLCVLSCHTLVRWWCTSTTRFRASSG